MLDSVYKKRKSTLISLCYFAVIILLYVLFMKYAFWIVSPFLFAFIISVILQKPIRSLSKNKPRRKKILSFVFVLLIVLILLGLVFLVGYKLVSEFSDFGKYIMGKLENTTELINNASAWAINLTNHLPKIFRSTAQESISALKENLLSYSLHSETIIQNSGESSASGISKMFDFSMLATPLSGILSTAKHIPAIVTAVIISIIACFFITSDYDNFTGMIKGMLTEDHENKLVKTKEIIVNVLGKWCKSYATILFITFCEILVGLNILKLCKVYTGGYIFVISICVALLDILPVFGTGTVMIPWAVISLLTHKIGLGIGLLIIYALIFLIRQVLEPRLVSANVDMHPVITLMAMYLGLQIFGFIGLILVPITLVVVKTLNEEGIIHIWGRAKTKE